MDLKEHELQTIPGVGKSIEKDLHLLGIYRVKDLRGKNPEHLYKKLCEIAGYQDRCLLYVFRCAVYYASNTKHDPYLLSWWHWKDKKKLLQAYS